MQRRIAAWSRHPQAQLILFVTALVESCLLPAPPVALLAVMVFYSPEKAWRYAGICFAGSAAGSILGYLFGALALEWFGRQLIAELGYQDSYDELSAAFHKWGWLVIIVKGLTPFPFQVATVFAGAIRLDFELFLFAVAVSRMARYGIICGVLVWLARKLPSNWRQ